MKYIEAEKKTSALTCVMLTVHPIYAEIQGVSLKKKYRTVFLVIHPLAEITQQ